jgi:hypothetical protein
MHTHSNTIREKVNINLPINLYNNNTLSSHLWVIAELMYSLLREHTEQVRAMWKLGDILDTV